MVTPYYADNTTTVYHGDSLTVLPTLPDNSVDAVVTDPPYGLEFMGKEWDKFDRRGPASFENLGGPFVSYGRTAESGNFRDKPRFSTMGPRATRQFQAWCELWAVECLRILKPGGHALMFGGTRTFHRLACAVEDAGFEIRDSIAWLYGSGFPKSLDVSKAIDRRGGVDIGWFGPWLREERRRRGISSNELAQHFPSKTGGETGCVRNWELGLNLPTADQFNLLCRVLELPFSEIAEAERQVTGRHTAGLYTGPSGVGAGGIGGDITAPATAEAQQWQGWGTALKPAFEPIVHARKPFNTVPLGPDESHIHHLLAALIWLSLSPAKRAALSSQSSRAAPPAGWCASALAAAATATSPGKSAETDTYSSPELALTFLSIVQSWSAILAALSDPTTTSTTATASSMTTGLRILNSLLAPLTSQTTIPRCECLSGGPSQLAPNAASRSTAEWANWLHTLSRSVPATASYATAQPVAVALASIAAEHSSGAEGVSTAPTPVTDSAAGNLEPVIVARKPLVGTVAGNVLRWGTGGLNVDACRIGDGERIQAAAGSTPGRQVGPMGLSGPYEAGDGRVYRTGGRWPANVVLGESAAKELDQQSGQRTSGTDAIGLGEGPTEGGSSYAGSGRVVSKFDDFGGASRFFYTAKASTEERIVHNGTAHPTVKPLDLMRWLVRLAVPPGGVCLDPFAGSGTTVEAALLEGFRCIAIEREADYLPLITQRVHRRRDPVQYLTAAGEDLGLFGDGG